MPRKLEMKAPYDVQVVAYEEEALRPQEVRARAVLSGISHGTELNLYRGTSPFTGKHFDRDLRIFLPGEDTTQPLQLGYEWVGRVEEVGGEVSHLQPGDLVHLLYPHAETHTFIPFEMRYRGLLQALPREMTPDQAIFIALAGVALQAVHDARIKVGDRVVVFGLGVIGLFVVQLALRNGAGWIDAFDPIARRRQLAQAYGANRVLDPSTCNPGYEVKAGSSHLGADVAIEVSGHYPALHEAIRCVRAGGLVVAAGYYQGGATALRLGEEWHHNRIAMVSSMAVWGNPHRDYPLWDRARIDRTVIPLLASGELITDSLISHRLPFAQASAAYALIDTQPQQVLKVALTYEE